MKITSLIEYLYHQSAPFKKIVSLNLNIMPRYCRTQHQCPIKFYLDTEGILRLYRELESAELSLTNSSASSTFDCRTKSSTTG